MKTHNRIDVPITWKRQVFHQQSTLEAREDGYLKCKQKTNFMNHTVVTVFLLKMKEFINPPLCQCVLSTKDKLPFLIVIRLAKSSFALSICICWPALFVPTANTTYCGLQANWQECILQAMLLNVPPGVPLTYQSLGSDRSPSANDLHQETEKMAP